MVLIGFLDIRNTNSVNAAQAMRDSMRKVIYSFGISSLAQYIFVGSVAFKQVFCVGTNRQNRIAFFPRKVHRCIDQSLGYSMSLIRLFHYSMQDGEPGGGVPFIGQIAHALAILFRQEEALLPVLMVCNNHSLFSL